GMPAASLRGSRFTLPLIPFSSRTSRRASSGVSFTSFNITYSKVMRSRRLSGKRRQASSSSSIPYFRLIGTSRSRCASVVECSEIARFGMSGSGATPPEAGRQPRERGKHTHGRQRDPARRHRQAVLVGEHPQRLHRLIVVVERLTHPHQDDREAGV